MQRGSHRGTRHKRHRWSQALLKELNAGLLQEAVNADFHDGCLWAAYGR
jgi:hypothetical protein